jgi:hypothetical protein
MNDEDKNIIHSPIRLKNYCINLIKNRVTDSFKFESSKYCFTIYEQLNEYSDKIKYTDFIENELVIFDYNKTNQNWIIFTTLRIIVNQNNEIKIINFGEIDDIDETTFDNIDWHGEKKEFDNFAIRLKNNTIILFEIKTGIPLMVLLNCFQRVVGFYFKYENKK